MFLVRATYLVAEIVGVTLTYNELSFEDFKVKQ